VPVAAVPAVTPQGYTITADASSQSNWTKQMPKTVQLLFAMFLVGLVAAIGVGIYHSHQQSNQNGHTADCLAASLSNEPPPDGC
jgi:hypothetical protein